MKTLSSHYGRSKLENGKILTEARYRFDVLTEPEVSNDPGNSDSHPTVPEEIMHLFQSEIYESDDSDMPIVSVLSDLPPLPVNYIFEAPIYGGTFNISITTVPEDQPQQRKRRRVIFDSDSSQE